MPIKRNSEWCDLGAAGRDFWMTTVETVKLLVTVCCGRIVCCHILLQIDNWRIASSCVDWSVVGVSVARIVITQSASLNLNLFSSREAEYEQRAQLLKRLSFTIYCSEVDQYQRHMPDIQGTFVICMVRGAPFVTQSTVSEQWRKLRALTQTRNKSPTPYSFFIYCQSSDGWGIYAGCLTFIQHQCTIG